MLCICFSTSDGLTGIVTDVKGRNGIESASDIGSRYTVQTSCIGSRAGGHTYTSILVRGRDTILGKLAK